MPDFASPSFGGFAFIGCLAVLTQFSFRPMTLRRRVLGRRHNSQVASSDRQGLTHLESQSSSPTRRFIASLAIIEPYGRPQSSRGRLPPPPPNGLIDINFLPMKKRYTDSGWIALARQSDERLAGDGQHPAFLT
jgi:hypothetical protein